MIKQYLIHLSIILILFLMTSCRDTSKSNIPVSAFGKVNDYAANQLEYNLLELERHMMMNEYKVTPFFNKGEKVQELMQMWQRDLNQINSYSELWSAYTSIYDSLLNITPHLDQLVEIENDYIAEFNDSNSKTELQNIKTVFGTHLNIVASRVVEELLDHVNGTCFRFYSIDVKSHGFQPSKDTYKFTLSESHLFDVSSENRFVVIDQVHFNKRETDVNHTIDELYIFSQIQFNALKSGSYSVSGRVIVPMRTKSREFPFTHTFRID